MKHAKKRLIIVVQKHVKRLLVAFEEQKALRKGNPDSNKIFNKGRSKNLIFKKYNMIASYYRALFALENNLDVLFIFINI